MTTERYIAADENGDIFIFTEMPTRHDDGKGGYWSCRGEEDPIVKDGLMKSFGYILNIPENVLMQVSWENEPIKIVLTIN